MNSTVADIQNKVRGVLQRRVVRASIFGSVARGEDSPESDVDFLVEFEAGRTLLDLSGLRLDLQDVLERCRCRYAAVAPSKARVSNFRGAGRDSMSRSVRILLEEILESAQRIRAYTWADGPLGIAAPKPIAARSRD